MLDTKLVTTLPFQATVTFGREIFLINILTRYCIKRGGIAHLVSRLSLNLGTQVQIPVGA